MAVENLVLGHYRNENIKESASGKIPHHLLPEYVKTETLLEIPFHMAKPESYIQVSKKDFTLNLEFRGFGIKYPVAIGKDSMETPSGDFFVAEKWEDPYWHPSDKFVLPRHPNNALGSRLIILYDPFTNLKIRTSIHGSYTKKPEQAKVTIGCVRMKEQDAIELFDLVDLGTIVKIE